MPVPTSWLGIVFFLVLLAPGFFFEQLSDRRRASPPETAFREAGRIVLASILFDLFGFLVLMGLQAVRVDLVPDPVGLLRDGSAYVAEHYNLIVRTFVVQLTVTAGAVVAVHSILVHREGAPTKTISLWRQLFRDQRPHGTTPYARVSVSNGTVYTGVVANYTADNVLTDREIILAPPLTVKPKDKPTVQLPPEYDRIWLPIGEIRSITVSYQRSAEALKHDETRRRQRGRHHRAGGPSYMVTQRKPPSIDAAVASGGPSPDAS